MLEGELDPRRNICSIRIVVRILHKFHDKMRRGGVKVLSKPLSRGGELAFEPFGAPANLNNQSQLTESDIPSIEELSAELDAFLRDANPE